MRSSTCLTVDSTSSWKRVMAVARRVLEEERELSHQVFQVVHHERGHLVEGLELARLQQRLEARLGEEGRHLARRGLQQIAHFPVHFDFARGVASTANPSSSSSAITGTTSHASGSSRSQAGISTARSPRRPGLDHPSGFRQETGEGAVGGSHALHRRHVPARCLRVRTLLLQPEALRRDSRPGRRARGSCAARGSCPAPARKKAGEAQPFGAVIVAVREEMLVDEYAQLRAQRARGEQPSEEEQRCGRPSPAASFPSCRRSSARSTRPRRLRAGTCRRRGRRWSGTPRRARTRYRSSSPCCVPWRER